MSQEKRPTARFEIEFAQPSLVKTFFQMLSRAPGFAFNLVRGRVTRSNARYELEFTGGEEAIERILSRCKRQGMRVRAFDVVL